MVIIVIPNKPHKDLKRDPSKRIVGLSQEIYFEKILVFYMHNCKLIYAPIKKGLCLDLDKCSNNDEQNEIIFNLMLEKRLK